MEATRKHVHMANGPRIGMTLNERGSLRPGESFTCHAAGAHFFVSVEEPWLVPRFFERGTRVRRCNLHKKARVLLINFISVRIKERRKRRGISLCKNILYPFFFSSLKPREEFVSQASDFLLSIIYFFTDLDPRETSISI